MELKRCPFCGGKAERVSVKQHEYYVHSVMCNDCKSCSSIEVSIKPRLRDSDNTAVINWNTRKPIDEIITKLESHFMAEENHINMGVYLDVINIVKGAINEQTTDTTL